MSPSAIACIVNQSIACIVISRSPASLSVNRLHRYQPIACIGIN
jgi:hypothetical protein